MSKKLFLPIQVVSTLDHYSWLNENYGMDVTAMIADVGQGEIWTRWWRKAYATGAKKAVVLIMRDEFRARVISVYPTVRAGPSTSTSICWTSIARR